MWGHLLPAAKRPPTLPAMEQLLSVDATAEDAAQQVCAAARSPLVLSQLWDLPALREYSS